jgi:hypothetical protein
MVPVYPQRSCLVLLLLVLFSVAADAQPPLPDMAAGNQKGLNVISWMNPYDGIKSIAVQRSSDSIYNFATIGYVKNLKKGVQAFVDGHPTPGPNFYRLYIVFSSDLTWYSNRVKLIVDSAQLLQQRVMPPNDSLQKMVNTLSLSELTDPNEINAYTYIRSQYVFTNPFTGHVNIELPDSADRKSVYSLAFFDQKNKQILEVPKVYEHSIILDKRNFQKKGIYKFELRKDREILESGYITIY